MVVPSCTTTSRTLSFCRSPHVKKDDDDSVILSSSLPPPPGVVVLLGEGSGSSRSRSRSSTCSGIGEGRPPPPYTDDDEDNKISTTTTTRQQHTPRIHSYYESSSYPFGGSKKEKEVVKEEKEGTVSRRRRGSLSLVQPYHSCSSSVFFSPAYDPFSYTLPSRLQSWLRPVGVSFCHPQLAEPPDISCSSSFSPSSISSLPLTFSSSSLPEKIIPPTLPRYFSRLKICAYRLDKLLLASLVGFPLCITLKGGATIHATLISLIAPDIPTYFPYDTSSSSTSSYTPVTPTFVSGPVFYCAGRGRSYGGLLLIDAAVERPTDRPVGCASVFVRRAFLRCFTPTKARVSNPLQVSNLKDHLLSFVAAKVGGILRTNTALLK